jgi:hypothetical protein
LTATIIVIIAFLVTIAKHLFIRNKVESKKKSAKHTRAMIVIPSSFLAKAVNAFHSATARKSAEMLTYKIHDFLSFR